MVTHTSSTDIVRLAAPLPADHQPVAVYLAGLAAGSKPTMRQALNSTAKLVTGDENATAADVPWHQMRFQHVQKIRQELEADDEDPRICAIGDRYLITYSAYSRHGVRIGLAQTQDFHSIERIALITQADYRNVVLFPEKFNGRYARLDRPHSEISPWSIWIPFSPDLIHWGDSQVVMKPQQYHWDEMKIGPGATPFATEQGWLHIYHGVFPTMDGTVYRLGVAESGYCSRRIPGKSWLCPQCCF
jgi:predicted GH43/DUF377 family glycosyl hydrolase